MVRNLTAASVGSMASAANAAGPTCIRIWPVQPNVTVSVSSPPQIVSASTSGMSFLSSRACMCICVRTAASASASARARGCVSGHSPQDGCGQRNVLCALIATHRTSLLYFSSPFSSFLFLSFLLPARHQAGCGIVQQQCAGVCRSKLTGLPDPLLCTCLPLVHIPSHTLTLAHTHTPQPYTAKSSRIQASARPAAAQQRARPSNTSCVGHQTQQRRDAPCTWPATWVRFQRCTQGDAAGTASRLLKESERGGGGEAGWDGMG